MSQGDAVTIWRVRPTPDLVADIWREGCEHFDCVSILSDKAAMTQTVAWLADLLGIANQDEWIDGRVITTGAIIYRPFVPGQHEDNWPLYHQLLVAVHEWEHVCQWRADKGGHFGEYALKGGRALIEAPAYAAEFQVLGWLEGRVVPVSEYEKRLRDVDIYGLSRGDIDSQVEAISIIQDVNAQGGVVSRPASWTIDWLRSKQ